MLAGTLDFTIPKDTDQTLSFTISGYDLRTYTAKLQIRKSFNDASPIVSLTQATGGGIVLGNGTFSWTFTNTQTNALSAGVYVYSFKIYNASGEKTRLIEGKITVTAEPTR